MQRIYILLSIVIFVSCSKFDLEPYQGKAIITDRINTGNQKLTLETCNITYQISGQNIKLSTYIGETMDELSNVLPIKFEYDDHPFFPRSTLLFLLGNDYTSFGRHFTSENEILSKFLSNQTENSNVQNEYASFFISRVDYDSKTYFLNDSKLNSLSKNAVKRIIAQTILETLGFSIANNESLSIFSNVLDLSTPYLFTEDDKKVIGQKYQNKCININKETKVNATLESISGKNAAYFKFDFKDIGDNSILKYGLLFDESSEPTYPGSQTSYFTEFYDFDTKTFKNLNELNILPIINKKYLSRNIMVTGINPGVNYRVKAFVRTIHGIFYSSEMKVFIPKQESPLKGETGEWTKFTRKNDYWIRDAVVVENNCYLLTSPYYQNGSPLVSKIDLKNNNFTTLPQIQLPSQPGKEIIFSKNNKIYCGGFSNSGNIYLSEFNSIDNKWVSLNIFKSFDAELSNLIEFDVVKSDSKIYLLAFSMNKLNIYEYDFLNNKLIPIKTIIDDRINGVKGHVIGNFMYLLYGSEIIENNMYHRNNFWKLNLTNNVLTQMPKIPSNVATNGAEIKNIDNKLYVLPKSQAIESYWWNRQGINRYGYEENKIWQYDLVTEKWEVLNHFLGSYLYLQPTSSFVYDNKFFMVQGNSIYYYKP